MKSSFRKKLPALILLILTVLAAAIYVAFFTDLPARLFGKKSSGAAVVGSCAGYDLTIDEVRYVTLLYRSELENRHGKGIWQDPEKSEFYRAELTETVLRELKNNYAILACAKYYLSESELGDRALTEAADQQIEELKTYYGGKDAFNEVLQSMNLTEEFLHFTLWVEEVRIKLYEKFETSGDIGLFSDLSAFYDWLKDGNCVYVQHVYLSNDEGEDPEENRALAQTIREDLLSGVDIATFLASSINDDLSNVAPRFMITGLCKESVWNEISFLAPENRVSRVVETESGFYVFLLMEEENGLLAEKVASLYEEYSLGRKSETVERYRDALTIEWNDLGKSIDFVTLN